MTELELADESLVSIIVATNRTAPFLRQALDSVMKQTYRHWELLIIDDGAPNSAEIDAIAASYPGVRVVHQANRGTSIARNVGAAATRGTFLVFLDDDDLWAPDRLLLQVRSLEQDPAAVASYCGMKSIDTNGRTIFAPDQSPATSHRNVVRREVGVMLPNLMIRRSAFERIGGFHPAFRRAQDLDLVLKAALDGPFVFVDDELVAYRAHAGNVTRERHELVRSIDRIVSLHQWAAKERADTEAFRDHKMSLRANRRFAGWSAARTAADHVRNRRYLRALRELAWSVRVAPDALVQFVWRRLGGR